MYLAEKNNFSINLEKKHVITATVFGYLKRILEDLYIQKLL